MWISTLLGPLPPLGGFAYVPVMSSYPLPHVPMVIITYACNGDATPLAFAPLRVSVGSLAASQHRRTRQGGFDVTLQDPPDCRPG